MHLANTTAIRQYEGLKHTNDHSDARWVAQLLHVIILPTGYIYPKEDLAIRDLLRKRSQLVRQKTSNLLSIQNLVTRNTGTSLTGNRFKTLSAETIRDVLPTPDLALAATSTLAVMRCAAEQIAAIEQAIKARVSLRPTFHQ